MKYNEIIELCLKIIKSYNPVIHTIDSHSDLFCQKISDENLKVFLKQVFYGYNRYKEFLQVFKTLYSEKYK